MSAVPTENSKKESNSTDMSMSESTRILVSFISFFVVSWSLSDEIGPFGAMGAALLTAFVMYLISFIYFKRKSTHLFRNPLSDATRIYVSVFMLIFMAANLSRDLGLLTSIGIALLLAAGTYTTSFVFFLRKSTETFRVPMGNWVRCLISIPLAGLVSSTLDVGFLIEWGYYVLCFAGAYVMSYLFFSKKVDTPQSATDAAGTSESS